MTDVLSLVDRVFGRLRVEARAASKSHRTMWRCRCQCGAVAVVEGGNLRAGRQVSCGCVRDERTHNLRFKHGATDTPEWLAWRNMRLRCNDPRNAQFDRYGGRGITVCDRWHEFAAFLADVGPRPSPGHSIDRKNVNGHYEPENVRWATIQEQARNRRSNVLIAVNGETLCAAAWAERSGIRRETILARIARGWSPEEAVSKVAERRGMRR